MLSWTESRSHICAPNPARTSREELIHRISVWHEQHGHKRAFGAGSVFQAKNGAWYGLVTVGRGPDGKRIRKKITGNSQESVEDAVAVAMQEAGIVATRPRRPRPLSNRSVDQLRLMYTAILAQQEAQ